MSLPVQDLVDGEGTKTSTRIEIVPPSLWSSRTCENCLECSACIHIYLLLKFSFCSLVFSISMAIWLWWPMKHLRPPFPVRHSIKKKSFPAWSRSCSDGHFPTSIVMDARFGAVYCGEWTTIPSALPLCAAWFCQDIWTLFTFLILHKKVNLPLL